jgi:hypothetical protein
MFKGLLATGALLLAASCGSHAAATPKTTPTPSVSWDDMGRKACAAAKDKADGAFTVYAGMSSMVEMNALRDRPDLIRAWCAENYRG